MTKPTKRQRPPRLLNSSDYLRMAMTDYRKPQWEVDSLQEKMLRSLARALAADYVLEERGERPALGQEEREMILVILERTLPPKRYGRYRAIIEGSRRSST